MQGKDWLNQKMYGNAEKYLKAALEKDVYFIPALVSLSSLYYKKGMYLDACELVKRVLSLDTYHGEANYCMDYVVVLWEIWQMPKMAFPWQHFLQVFVRLLMSSWVNFI